MREQLQGEDDQRPGDYGSVGELQTLEYVNQYGEKELCCSEDYCNGDNFTESTLMILFLTLFCAAISV